MSRPLREREEVPPALLPLPLNHHHPPTPAPAPAAASLAKYSSQAQFYKHRDTVFAGAMWNEDNYRDTNGRKILL